MATGFVYHELFLHHNTGPGHPECADRLRAIISHLQETKLLPELQHLIIDNAPEEWILRVHTTEHMKYLREASQRGVQILDQGDTRASKQSYDVAMLAAGGVLAGVDAIMTGVLENAFCAVRPPGHHAGRNRVMGFCLLNNAAIAARYAQRMYGAERVAIIDWDVHHGNGTQEIFYEDRSVFYMSMHQYPLYPGTGSRGEQGSGTGEGYTLNIPMRPGSGEREYLEAFQRDILPALDGYRPHLIIISAGFDAHRDDPLGNIELTEESFAAMTTLIVAAAETYCQGKILSILEGGYDLTALARSVEAHLHILLGEQLPDRTKKDFPPRSS